MKKSVLKKVFAVFIAGAAALSLCLSVAAFSKASKTEEIAEVTTSGKTAEEIEADKEQIREYLARGTCKSVAIIPYTDQSEQCYFIMCLSGCGEIGVYKIVDGEVRKVYDKRLK